TENGSSAKTARPGGETKRIRQGCGFLIGPCLRLLIPWKARLFRKRTRNETARAETTPNATIPLLLSNSDTQILVITSYMALPPTPDKTSVRRADNMPMKRVIRARITILL